MAGDAIRNLALPRQGIVLAKNSLQSYDFSSCSPKNLLGQNAIDVRLIQPVEGRIVPVRQRPAARDDLT